jgi:hypothetical protein
MKEFIIISIAVVIPIFIVVFVVTYFIQELVQKLGEMTNAIKRHGEDIEDLEFRVEELEEKLKTRKNDISISNNFF